MDQVIENKQEQPKEWSTPELKKIDIEQITASGIHFNADGNGGSQLLLLRKPAAILGEVAGTGIVENRGQTGSNRVINPLRNS